MRLTRYQSDPPGHQTRYVLEFNDAELVAAKLYPADRALLAECDGPDATVSDRLLGLELLARRIEEAHAAGGEGSA
jgi:hypothetical protein